MLAIKTAGRFDRIFARLGLLDPTGPLRVHPRILGGIVGYHLAALLACIPWLFSWSGVALAIFGIYVFGTLGVNVGFHRLLTHRAFACPKWLEHFLTHLGSCCWQGTPMNWVAVHRMHHQHSDNPPDPHTPRQGFFWSHMGWFLIYNPAVWNIGTYDRYARDLLRDRFFKNYERPRIWRRTHFILWAIYLIGGAITGALIEETWIGALQMALSWLVWGVFVRTVLVWHITWSINSVTHIWGYRNFDTRDDSKNNLLIGLISNGEGWHNNHHAQPQGAAHGMRWFEFDVSWITIRSLEAVGLAWDVVRPKKTREIDPLEGERLTFSRESESAETSASATGDALVSADSDSRLNKFVYWMFTMKQLTATFCLIMCCVSCASDKKETDTTFTNLPTLAAAIAKAEKVTLYEGLPHQSDEEQLLAKELKEKKTVTLNGFPFYAETLELKAEDAKKLTALAGNEKNFQKWGGPKACGGFHPDYLVEWKVGSDTYRMQVCFGCHEIKLFGPKVELYCDMSDDGLHGLEDVLKGYRKNRPKE